MTPGNENSSLGSKPPYRASDAAATEGAYRQFDPGLNSDTKRAYLEREASRSDPLRQATPTHGEDGEVLPDLRVLVRRAAADCPIIAPICATCGHEIDKDGRGWFHVGAPNGKGDS